MTPAHIEAAGWAILLAGWGVSMAIRAWRER